MIISLKYADKLIKQGRAQVVGVAIDNGREWLVISRSDNRRIDHSKLPKTRVNTQKIKAECLDFIRLNDRNGFETLEGNESIEDLLAAVESIKNQ